MATLLNFLFWCHDLASDFLTKHLFMVKNGILVGAHVSLLGILFPEMRQGYGSVAVIVLLFLLFLSPVSQLFRMKLLLQAMALRREIGILMGYLATVHVVGYLIDPDWFDFLITPYWPGDLLSIDIRYQLGFLAYFLTLPLLLTSNIWANRVLGGKNWKRLHRLVYPLLFFALFHKFLRAGEVQIQDVVMPTVILTVYILLKIGARKQNVLLLQKGIEWVALRYQSYRATRVAHV